MERMRAVFDGYGPDETIPVREYLKKKKLIKYFNRETAAAITAVGKLTADISLDAETPFYYAAGLLEYEDYGFMDIIERSRDEAGQFSQDLFIKEGIPLMSPLSQFKVLQNMPLSFVAVEYGLTGDNAVIYTSAEGLIQLGLYAPGRGPVLLAAGRTYKDGSVDMGVAYVEKSRLETLLPEAKGREAVDVLREWGES